MNRKRKGMDKRAMETERRRDKINDRACTGEIRMGRAGGD